MDYEGVFQESVQFEEGQHSMIVDISIINDNLAEGVETFSGKLEVTGPNQNFSTAIKIEIIDDQRKLSKTGYTCLVFSPFFN